MPDQPFWIDYEWDRDRASDGKSRYGAYVRHAMDEFRETWDGSHESGLRERFAVIAWRTATGPVMSPPFASWRTPVLSARLQVNYDADLSLLTTVELASGWPMGLAHGYDGQRHWRSWPRERSLGEEYARDPYGEEIAVGGCYALSSLRLVFTLPSGQLPDAPRADHRRGEVEQTARTAVEGIVAALNAVVIPVLTRIEER